MPSTYLKDAEACLRGSGGGLVLGYSSASPDVDSVTVTGMAPRSLRIGRVTSMRIRGLAFDETAEIIVTVGTIANVVITEELITFTLTHDTIAEATVTLTQGDYSWVGSVRFTASDRRRSGVGTRLRRRMA